MAASVASTTCCHGTRQPTGLARNAGGSRRGRALTASSNSRRLTSWNGWPISCRRCGCTGIARRFEASQGCSPRITSSGPPSSPSRSGMSASGAMPRLMGMRSADMRRAERPPPTAATHATNSPPTTPRDAKGQTHGPRGGGVSCCVRGVWCRHPAQSRRSAGAGFLRTGGSQASEGQDGFARRAARDRPPQPLTGSHATVRTAREKSGFKTGLRRREKSGLERGEEALRHLHDRVASSPISSGGCSS
jgi:hypothetical protein